MTNVPPLTGSPSASPGQPIRDAGFARSMPPANSTSPMSRFLRDRGSSLALVILIMLVISLGQAGISYTMAFGALSAVLPRDRSGVATSLVILRFGLVALMAVLWALRRKRALFQLIVVANALSTLALLIQTISLISALFGGASEAVNALMLDVVLMATSSILIFSVWYWGIDPPGIEDVSRADEPWDFLFPQRGSPLPHYDGWVPICSLPSRPALRSARPTHCRLPAPRC